MSLKNKYIIYIGGFRLPDGTASAQRAIANAKMFKELGFNVIFAGKGIYDDKSPEWFEVNGFLVYNITYKKNDITTNIDFVNAILEKFNIDDIYAMVAYNYPGIALNKLRKFCESHNIIAISEATEWYAFELSKNLVSSIIRKLQTEYRMRYVNKKIGNIICSTKYIQSYYKKYNTMINPNVVDLNDSKWSGRYANHFNSKKTFVYAGSPGKNMNKDKIDYIVKAFSEIDEKKYPYLLEIIGVTEEQFLRRFPSYLNILIKKRCNIVFYGRITHEEVLKKLKCADFTIIFRLDTKVSRVGFATKISESISCGIPVIANDEYGEIEYYLKNNEHGIFFKGFEIEKLKEAILQSLKLSDEAISLMKSKCNTNNPFKYENFLKATMEFLKLADKRMRG